MRNDSIEPLPRSSPVARIERGLIVSWSSCTGELLKGGVGQSLLIVI